ncbi:hypothetical protein [Sphingomonas jatrophae]|uniref:Nucleotide-diphospho-sugar transferase n=1 Tax=Sphingomonas jatrophae TaxID=1166337 RepID=A0A1I6LKY5_9SPHN|nr:hypothetical protein [Sphingomonas jatrophae]SFS04063.1 hypothetical protein SAMN05192580_2871 [Sphingomonas jatrophae]
MLVVQSWRDGDCPPWLARCLDSVEGWARGAGFAYRRLGDALFDPLPAWTLAAADGARLALTDLARLLWIEPLLDTADAVLWLDADVLVFDPAAMRLPDAPAALARERWIWRDSASIHADERLSNAAMLFTAGDGLLAWYRRTAETILRDAPKPLNRTALGPQLLTALGRARPVPRIECVPTLSPALMEDLLAGDGPALASHRAHWAHPVGAAHLCRSLGGTPDAPDLVGEGVQAELVERLLREGGTALSSAQTC